MPFLNPWVILALVLAFGGATTGAYLKGHSNGTATNEAKWVEANAEADRKLAAAILKNKDDVIAAERAFNEFKDKVENEHAEKDAYINGMRIANGRLVTATGGLYDKNGRAVAGRGNTVPGAAEAAGVGATAAAGCQLSGEITGDLLDFARDADLVLNTARACQAWAIGLPR